MTSPAKLSTDGLDDKSLAHALRSLHDSGMATIEKPIPRTRSRR